MESNNNQPSFVIQKVYTKDVSFESINSPDIFKQQWNPSVDFNIDINSRKIDDNNYEVDLTVTLNTKTGDTNAYVAEVTQSGIFTLSGVPEQQIDSILNTYCPNTLFPYAKRVLDSSVIRGGFLPLNLSPINFDAIYLQKQNTSESQHWF